ncbi:SDR family oxidoreductase [Nesterenkonia xinjiangensis]|uniref:NADP-dependent 3-hydroxy acid dehydrogenase YdfG n=1 Tax=Nesterenkonia xinjiangensis TaxID=225327 RepID=A0A7Z0GN23_9MICC|nr:SDR family oxidoreductase [Nesterenkonia xinjiangensis]NYJ79020.1 NADP-dependent 3-hydroxy acid dehydrogenase YdfG [Nesterenkonia xinjiangensis]
MSESNPAAALERPLALVTGATRGIGRAIAEDLGRTHHVLVGGTSAERVSEVVAALPSSGPFVADLTDAEAVAAALEETGLERLDVLVHSAGVAGSGEVGTASLELWRHMFEVNVFAVAELTRQTLQALRTARGQVIAINSGSGYTSRAGGGIYSGSKFALRALTDALRDEERGTVRVTSIHPGRVDTDMQRELQSQMGNRDYDGSIYIAPQSVADTVRLAVDMPEASMVEDLSIRPVHR